ncbi:MAG: RNA pseudouridine synthase [Planctomycetia bacterium]|nr:RNA pseudouridine synthase [Planctomycetia bacterium]
MNEPAVEVLYESGPCLVVLKPAGVLTQAPPGIDSLEARIKAWFKRRDNKPGNVYLGVPHRLDRPVSGAMVFARHARAARRLSEQFEGRLVRKVYWACVEREVAPREGTWSDYVRKVPGEPRAELVAQDHPEGRAAVLHYRVLESASWGSWLEIELETGRTHQVRVQAAARGHPILGDALYGAAGTFGPAHEDERLRAIALHGRGLSFRHPMTQEMVSVTAPVAQAWHELGIGNECGTMNDE